MPTASRILHANCDRIESDIAAVAAGYGKLTDTQRLKKLDDMRSKLAAWRAGLTDELTEE